MDTQETTLLTAITISIVVVGVIICYFIFSLLKQQKRNLELSRRNVLAEINAMERGFSPAGRALAFELASCLPRRV